MAWGRKADPRRFWVEEVIPGALARQRWARRWGRARRVVEAMQGATEMGVHVAAAGGLVGIVALLLRPLGGRALFPAERVLADVGLVLTAFGVAGFLVFVGLYMLAGGLRRWLARPEPPRVTALRIGRSVIRGLLRTPLWLAQAAVLAVVFVTSFALHAIAQLAVMLGLLHPSVFDGE